MTAARHDLDLIDWRFPMVPGAVGPALRGFGLACLVIVLAARQALALGPVEDEKDPVRVTFDLGALDTARNPPGFPFSLRFVIAEGYHINPHDSDKETQPPTTVTFELPEGLESTSLEWPPPKKVRIAILGETLEVYGGTTEIKGWFIPKDARSAGKTIQANLRFQTCSDLACLMPKTVKLTVQIPPFSLAGAKKIAGPAASTSPVPSSRPPGPPEGGRGFVDLRASFSGRGFFVTLFLIFLGGMALNLTPCVYPIIPITVSFFGGQASGSLRSAFFLALSYVLGMSVTYSIMGVTASLVGGVFGSALQSPWMASGVAFVFLIMALSMFGLFEIQAPRFIMERTGARQGRLGAFFMGLVVGFVAAPCIGPFVVSLMVYVGQLGSPFLGFWIFFILAMGLGFPYLFLGTFSGALASLPTAGQWMITVKRFFGVVMLMMALYYLDFVLPRTLILALVTLVMVASAVASGALEPLPHEEDPSYWFRVLAKTMGVLLLLTGAIVAWELLGLTGLISPSRGTGYSRGTSGILWSEDLSQIDEARSLGRPVIIDFFSAIWCPACKEFEERTFSDSGVIQESKRFMNVRIDLDRHPSRDKMVTLYGVKGAPTLIFVDSKGRVRKDLGITGFVPPRTFVDVLRQVN